MKKIFVVVYLLFSYSALCQNRLSVEQYSLLVVEYNLSLKQSQQSVDYSQDNLKKQKRSALPSLTLSSEAYYNVHHPNMSSAVKNFNYLSYLTLGQTVYSGGATRANTKIAKLELDQAQEERSTALLNTRLSAYMSYWALSAAKSQLIVSEQYIDILSHLLKIIKTRESEGYIAHTDLLMMQTQLSGAEYSRAQAEKYYKEALISFNILMGSRQRVDFELTSSLETEENLINIFDNDFHYTSHPTYLSALYSSQKADENIALSRSAYNPSLWVGVRGDFGTAPQNTDLKPKVWGTALATLSVPIFGWGSRKLSVSKAKSSSQIAKLELEQTSDNLIDSYQSADIDLRQTDSQLTLSKNSLETASENLELQTFSYTEGKMPITYILQAQISWLEAYNNYISSAYNYKISIAKYRYATDFF